MLSNGTFKERGGWREWNKSYSRLFYKMAQNVSALVNEIRLGLNNPTEEQLSTTLMLLALWDAQSILNNELTLSQQNWFLSKVDLGIPAMDALFPAADYNSIVKVEYCIDPVYQTYRDVRIVNQADFNQSTREGYFVCAVYGTPAHLAFNFDPNLWLQPIYGFRAWYEPSQANPTIQGSVGVNQSFHALLKNMVISFCGENYLNRPTTPSLANQQAVLWEQFKQWAHRSNEQRPARRRPSYGVDPYSDDEWRNFY